MQPKTKTIANHAVTLVPGQRYVAARPIAETGMTAFPVSIYAAPVDLAAAPIVTVAGLDYAAANEFLAEFNNGNSSFAGRVW